MIKVATDTQGTKALEGQQNTWFENGGHYWCFSSFKRKFVEQIITISDGLAEPWNCVNKNRESDGQGQVSIVLHMDLTAFVNE